MPDVIHGPSDERPVGFPIAPWIDYNVVNGSLNLVNGSVSTVPVIEYPSVVRGRLLQLPGARSDNRLMWVELPQDVFSFISIGLVILLPQTSQQLEQGDQGSDMLVCIVGAGWGPSLLGVSTFDNSVTATSSSVTLINNLGNQLQAYDAYIQLLSNAPPDESSLSQTNIYQSTTDIPVTFSIPHYPPRPVLTTQDWAEHLNPLVPGTNSTVFDVLLKASSRNNSRGLNPAAAAAAAAGEIISALMANGMARTASTSRLQGAIRLTEDANNETIPDGTLWFQGKEDFFVVDPEESANWVKLRVDSTLEGYSYNITGASVKVAIVFLLIYCVLALAHIFYSMISGMFLRPSSLQILNSLNTLSLTTEPLSVRHKLHVLGFYRRSDCSRHEFITYDGPEEYLCWYWRDWNLQDPSSHSGGE